MWNWHSKASSTYAPESMPHTKSWYRKIKYACQAAIFKVTLLKINRLLIDTNDVSLKFGLDIQCQTRVRVWKPKIPRWSPGGHFKKIDRILPMATNNMHIKCQIEIPKQTWVLLRKPCRLQTDGQTDRRTRWFQYTPHQLRWAGV